MVVGISTTGLHDVHVLTSTKTNKPMKIQDRGEFLGQKKF